MNEQPGFFDLEDRYALLSDRGDPLERLNEVISFGDFRPLLEDALDRKDRGLGGRPPMDASIVRAPAQRNPAQWSFHALRAHPGLGSAHLSCRATWMLPDRAPSWRYVSNAINVCNGSFVDVEGSPP